MAQVTELKCYGTMGGLYGRSFAGKASEETVAISVVIDQKDLRLIRPRVLKCLWWLIVGVTWLSL